MINSLLRLCGLYNYYKLITQSQTSNWTQSKNDNIIIKRKAANDWYFCMKDNRNNDHCTSKVQVTIPIVTLKFKIHSTTLVFKVVKLFFSLMAELLKGWLRVFLFFKWDCMRNYPY